jgi:multidrug efflux pump subunit AcrA (membrane-fusion protein)
MKFVFGVFVLVVFLSCSNKQDKINPQKRRLVESVYASVTIQPDSLYNAYAIVSGIVEQNFVEEGDLVSKDQVIVQIVNRNPKLSSENAKLALKLAKDNYIGSATILNSIEDEIIAARLQFQNDSINFFRQENLWNQNIGSKAEYDTKKLRYKLSRNTLQLLKGNYEQTKRELSTALQQAENNYESSLINTKDFSIKSKINGKAYTLFKEPGEIITSIEPVALIGSADKFLIEMLIDEVDIAKIEKNQHVVLTLDAYQGDTFEGNVTKIYPKKDERNQTFLVEAVFKEMPKVLYPGLSGEANIIISEKDSVLTIPKNYVIDFDKVLTDKGLITIEIGLQNMEYIEVISGISEDTDIYKPEK